MGRTTHLRRILPCLWPFHYGRISPLVQSSYAQSGVANAFVLCSVWCSSLPEFAIKWCSDHRRHHLKTDEEEDPYTVKKGFMWAHMGWVMVDQGEEIVEHVEDLQADKILAWQDRHIFLIDSWSESSCLVQSVILLLEEPMGSLAV